MQKTILMFGAVLLAACFDSDSINTNSNSEVINPAEPEGLIRGLALPPASLAFDSGYLHLRTYDNAAVDTVLAEASIEFEGIDGGIPYEISVAAGDVGVSLLLSESDNVDWDNIAAGDIFRHYHCELSDISMPCTDSGLTIHADTTTTLNLALYLGGNTVNLFDGDTLLNVAHGAGQGERPDFTFEAYDHLISLGPDIVFEADINGTADGIAVIMHDSTLDRKTDYDEINCPDKQPAPEGMHFTHNDCGRISSLTFEDIQQYDAAYHWSSDGETFPFRGQGVRVVSLEETFQRYPDAHYVIELKPEEDAGVRSITQQDLDTAVEVARLIRAYRMQERVTVASFVDELIEAFRAEDPSIDTAFSEAEVLPLMLAVFSNDESYQLPENSGQFLQIPENYTLNGVPLNLVNANNVRLLHERYGKKVHVWTINESEDLNRLLAVPGLAAIMTDYPQRLQSLIQE